MQLVLFLGLILVSCYSNRQGALVIERSVALSPSTTLRINAVEGSKCPLRLRSVTGSILTTLATAIHNL